ncbi:MAG: hypothetical protein ACOX5G_08360 [Kiritimatiellia bacterium]
MKTSAPLSFAALLALALGPPLASRAASVPAAGATTARLAGPYEDPRQSEVNFGQRSYYLTPWRAYMDTWPASRWFEMPGVNFGDGAETTARLLAEAGFRSARIEWGWGNMAWEGGRFGNEEGMKRTLRALRAAGLRPLILLNAHHGVPCATRWFPAKLAEDAPAGQRFIVLENLDGVRTGYTGLTNLNDYRAIYPILVSADPATGRCELSAPLPVDLEAGDITLSETKVRPLSGSVNPDGTPNPDCAESIAHWMDYVATACRVAKEGLGTGEDPSDAGFDIEVWNEYTFGSCFLDINNYYDPRIEFQEPLVYRNAAGLEARGAEALLPMVVDFVRDPANHCPGVVLINGFANQRPWDNLTERWPGLDAISRHYYSGATPRVIDADHPDQPGNGPVNALGEREGKPDGRDWHTVEPGSFFIPSQSWALPEWWHYAIATEYITRDTLPFPSTRGGPVPFTRHHRYGHNGDGRPGQVWRTEVNTFRADFHGKVMREAGCEGDDPRLVSMMHGLAARWLLRELLFCGHKGETTHNVFHAQGRDDAAFGVLPSTYFDALEKAGGQLTDEVRAAVGPQVEAVGRVTRMFREGKPIDVARKLGVAALVEHDPRLFWKGDGTPGNPDRFHRDDFAILPFQLDERTFAIGYYVVTHDITKVWDDSADPLDPARYSMPPQTFDITFENLRGKGARVSAWDPITDAGVPVQVLERGSDELVVRVESTDYPRFLRVVENREGPMLSNVSFSRDTDGVPVVAFTGNVRGTVEVACGAFPARGGTGDNGASPRTVKVKPGVPAKVRLDGADVGTDAVKLEYEANDLEMTWPQWDHDLRGILQFALDGLSPTPAVDIPASRPPLRLLPGLPAENRAASAVLPDPLPSKAGRAAISAKIVPGAADADAAQGLLPALAASDRHEIAVAEWNGFPAWRIRLDLDPAMHPGAKRLARESWIAPLADGLLFFSAEAAGAADLAASGEAVEAVRKSLVLR